MTAMTSSGPSASQTISVSGEFVVNFEKAALEQEGHAGLAADVLWVAREVGDGAGYDYANPDVATI